MVWLPSHGLLYTSYVRRLLIGSDKVRDHLRAKFIIPYACVHRVPTSRQCDAGIMNDSCHFSVYICICMLFWYRSKIIALCFCNESGFFSKVVLQISDDGDDDRDVVYCVHIDSLFDSDFQSKRMVGGTCTKEQIFAFFFGDGDLHGENTSTGLIDIEPFRFTTF